MTIQSQPVEYIFQTWCKQSPFRTNRYIEFFTKKKLYLPKIILIPTLVKPNIPIINSGVLSNPIFDSFQNFYWNDPTCAVIGTITAEYVPGDITATTLVVSAL